MWQIKPGYLMWWPIDLRTLGIFLFLPKNIFEGPPRGGLPPQKWNFKVFGIICCWHSKLVSQDAWHIAKGISSIRAPCPEKTSKTWSYFAVSGRHLNTPIFMRFGDVFSRQGDRIELIPFALCQASWDTSLEYPQHIIARTLKFHFLGADPP